MIWWILRYAGLGAWVTGLWFVFRENWVLALMIWAGGVAWAYGSGMTVRWYPEEHEA